MTRAGGAPDHRGVRRSRWRPGGVSSALERSVPEPMLPLDLFRRRAFTGVQLAGGGSSASLFALFLYLDRSTSRTTSQNSPLQAGAAGPADHAWGVHRGPHRGRAATARSSPCADGGGAGGDGDRAGADVGHDAGSSWTVLLPGFIVAGLGVGILNPVIADVALSVVPKDAAAWRQV